MNANLLNQRWQLRSPESAADWQAYYQLRWQILRAPWLQALGSERDELEQDAYHLMLTNAAGELIAVGRLHQVDAETAQVRYMAVASEWQGQGAGAAVLQGLEHYAISQGYKKLLLNARDSALPFYLRQQYHVLGSAPSMFGIVHQRMSKTLMLAGTDSEFRQWCADLQQTWHSTIPLSQFMQLQITSFDGFSLQCQAPLAPNINLHQTMFAGSIYTLATLTGWGMLYLQLQSLGLAGAQVLAEGNIRYLQPVRSTPTARCHLADVRGDLSTLASGRRVRQQITVDIFVDEQHCAQFVGLYAVLPEQSDD